MTRLSSEGAAAMAIAAMLAPMTARALEAPAGCTDAQTTAVTPKPMATPTAPAIVVEAKVIEACALSVADYQKEHASLQVIDTRDHVERQRARLPRALAIQAGDIANKGFLKAGTVALVGTGLDDRELFAFCGELRRAQWQAKVLVGGVPALANGGETIEIRSADFESGNGISPAEAYRFAIMVPTRVVVVGPETKTPLPVSLEKTERWPLKGDWTDLARRLKAVADAKLDVALVVVMGTSEAERRLQEALRSAGAGRVFVLRGGLGSYVAYLTQQQSISAHANQALRKPCGAG